MTSLLLASAVTLWTPQASVQAQIEKSLAVYEQTKALYGQVRFVQTAAGKSVTIFSDVQLQWPNKLYIKQQSQEAGGKRSWAVADGKTMSYDPPASVQSRKRLAEAQGTKNVGEVFAVFGSTLLDRSPLIDILVGRPADIKFLKMQWVNGKFIESENANKVIEGDWRPYQASSVTGKYRMEITPEDQLVRYDVSETLSLPNVGVVTVHSRWDAVITLGKIQDEKLFNPN